MNYKLFMKRGLCLVTMSSLLLSGCGSESTKLLSDTPADVQTESTTEEKVESKEKVSRLLDDFITSSSDRCLIYTSHDSKMDDFADEVYEIDDYDLVKVEK